MLNKYRVLLILAMEGIIIWMPESKDDDPTRRPDFWDGTAGYLQECGVSMPDE